MDSTPSVEIGALSITDGEGPGGVDAWFDWARSVASNEGPEAHRSASPEMPEDGMGEAELDEARDVWLQWAQQVADAS